MSAYTVPAIFQAIDKFSEPLQKMENATESLAKKIEGRMAAVDRSFRKVGESAQNIGRNSLIFGTAVLAPLGLMVNEAVKFEDKMADVAKVTGTQLGTKEFQELGNSAKDLAMFLAIDATEAAGLVQNLAQGGVAVQDLDKVSKIAGKVGVAFGISGDIAGESFVKVKNALGGTIESTEKLMDSINFLGNTTAAASPQLLEFMAAGGAGVSRALDVSAEASAAFGSTLISMGKSAAESATIYERFSKGIMKNKDLRSVFEQAGGGIEGVMKVLEKGKSLDGNKQFAFFQKFGEYGASIRLMAQNYGVLSSTVKSATDEQLIHNSVLNEFENRQQTMAVKMQRLQTKFKILAIDLGTLLLPVLEKIINIISPVIEKMIDWAKANPKTAKTILMIVAAIGALAIGVAAISFTIAALAKVWGVATAAMWLFNLAMAANPIVWVIAAVIALIAAVTLIIVKFEEWGAALGMLFAPFMPILMLVISLIMSFRRNWDMIVSSFKNGGILDGLKAIGATLIDALLMPMQQLLEMTAKFTGWDLAASAASKIEQLRANVGVQIEPINTQATKETVRTERESMFNGKGMLDININDRENRASVSNSPSWANVNLSPTF